MNGMCNVHEGSENSIQNFVVKH